MATLKELAEYTGFSAATISRILNNDPTMAASEETRKKILEAADTLNYAATKSRKGRAPKTNLRIALAEMLTPAEQLADPYYLYLRRYVERECTAQRIELFPLTQLEDRFTPPASGAFDGLIAIGIFTPVQVDSLLALHANVVFLDSSPDETRADSVVINYRLGVEQALAHLVDRGHTKIGFIGPKTKLDDHKQPAPEVRRRIYVEWMLAHGLYDPSLLIDVPMSAQQTGQALHDRILAGEAMPTALLTANEESALGAIHALQQADLRVPDDVSVISFNNTPLSELTEPPLTSVTTHMREMSQAAVRLACERVGGRRKPPIRALPVKLIVPPSLVLRGSVAPPRATART